ncbi:MAG: 8-oxo-dGTP diphosphatase [Candidatus Saccharimonadales bacterium]
MKICTLLLLVQDDAILLAMKKRGFGAGRWNGVGGKLDAGETIEQAMIRECQEEISVTPTSYEKVAIHDFVFPDGATDMQVHTFVGNAWEGDPAETEEMAPQWFKLSDIPYDDMWQDDPHWLPQVLAGQKLHTRFTFDDQDNLLDTKIHEAVILE